MKTRIQYLDACKGLLIILLFYGHLKIITEWNGFSDPVLTAIGKTIPLYACFFMQTFFVITGFCTSFNIGFKLYLWKNIKTLLLPALILCFLGGYLKDFLTGVYNCRLESISKWFYLENNGPWFIFAMFYAKIIYYVVKKIGNGLQACLVLIFYMLGLITNYFNIPNIQWYQHAFLMLPYLFIGEHLKDVKFDFEKYLGPFALCGFLVINIEFLLSLYTPFYLPIHDEYISLGYLAPLHFINVLLGSSVVFWIAKKMEHFKMLKNIGVWSLLFYLLNEPIQILSLKLIKPFYDADNYILCCILYFVSYVFCLAIMYCIAYYIYNRRYLSWIVGKW